MIPWRVVEIMNYNQEKFGVIGPGAWGTAIARYLAIKGYPVRLWSYEISTAESIKKNHLHNFF